MYVFNYFQKWHCLNLNASTHNDYGWIIWHVLKAFPWDIKVEIYFKYICMYVPMCKYVPTYINTYINSLFKYLKIHSIENQTHV